MNEKKSAAESSPREKSYTPASSEIRYRRLFETAKDGILILDAETGQIDDVNPFLLDLLHYSREQFINKKIWDIGFFRDIIANKEKFLQLTRKKYVRYEDLPLETADGQKIDVEFVSNVYPEDHHDVIQCNIRDITERKRTADLIAVAHERLAVTLQSIGDGVITTDTRGHIDMMNAVAEKLCGWKQSEVQGRAMSSFVHIINENTRQPQENPVDKVLATGQIIELANHTVLIARDGTERIIADSAAPIRDKQGTIIGVVLVFRDITEKQKLLEIAERNQRLESLGLLAGGIAHDFNNLMSGVFGNIDLALAEAIGAKAGRYLSRAITAMDRARGLTQQLLTFAKGGHPVRKAMPVSQLVRDTAQFALSGSNVSYRCDLPEDLRWCLIDQGQIGQVIDNIVINAQQAMPGGGRIDIAAANVSLAKHEHQTLPPGDYVKLSIRDYGIGISKKLLLRIFDPFFTTKPKGHGLGLATCHSIATRHGGAIDVESELDKGSTFHLYLPVAGDEPSVTAPSAGARHKGGGGILIMDDEEVIRGVLGDILRKYGYTVTCKNDGRAAIDFFNEETGAGRPLVGLFIDLTVPLGMGGEEVIKEIRRSNPDIPAFVVSGDTDDPIMKNPGQYGFTASISKPFRMTELSDMLETYLKAGK